MLGKGKFTRRFMSGSKPYAITAAALSGAHVFVTGATCAFNNKQLTGNIKGISYNMVSVFVLMAIFVMLVVGKTKQDDDAPNTPAHAMYTSSLSILAVLVVISIMNQGKSQNCQSLYGYSKGALLVILLVLTAIGAKNA